MASLTDVDWDEELKRQAAISALLAPQPDEQPLDTKTDEQVVASPEVVKPDDTSDYHKLINQAFDTETDEQVTGDQGTVYPTIAQDQGQPDKKFDTAVAESVVPYDEREKPPAPPPPYTQMDTGKGVSPEAYPTVAQDQGAGEGSGQQAPDALAQVEPGEEWREPWHPAGTPAPASAVKWQGNKLVDKDGNVVADETPPGAKYPDQIVTPDEASGKTSVVNAPVTPPPAAAAAPANPVVVAPAKSDWDSLVNSTWPSAKKEPEAVAAGDVPPMMNAPNGQPPAALIIHHTGGNNSAESVVNDWRTNRPGVGAQMIMDRDGVIHETKKEFGYGGTGNFLHSVVPGVNNQTAVGIEVIAKDDADMTAAQLESLKRLAGPKGPYANVPVYGHSQVSPGDRENEGVRGVNAINEARAGGGTTTEAGEPPIQTLVRLDQSGLNVTHFGYQSDENLDKDSAAGHGAYIENMIPGYDVALNSKAAALVGNPKPGETFQFAGKEWRYGDKVPEKYTDPRFDIYDQDGTALTGAMPVGKSVAAVAGPEKMPWDDWVKLSPEDQAAADKVSQTKQQEILAGIRDKTSSMPAFVRALENPIPGVSDPVRLATAAEFKKQITAYAQDYYKEPDPDKAYARIMGNADFGTLLGEAGSKILPNLSHAGLSFAQQAVSASPLLQFINVAEPNATPEARLALVKQVMAQPDEDRAQFIKSLYSHLGSDQAQNVDLNALLNWSDTISQPGVKEEQAKRLAGINAAVAQNRKDLREDPTLQGTLGGTIANAVAAYPKNFLEAVTPYLGQSVMAAEIYSDTKESLRQEHPGWTEDQLSAHAAAVSIPQDVLQELINVGTLGLGGGVLRGIENPIARMATSSIAHGVVTGLAGAGQQAVASFAAGKTPTAEELIQAGVGGAVQGAIGGAIGGRHGAEVEVPEHVTPVEPKPVSRAEMLGPDVPPEPTPPRPWYLQGAEPGQDPLVIRGAEREAFTPQELSESIQRLPAGTPEELASRIKSLQSPAAWYLGDEGTQEEVQQAKGAQAPSPPPTLAEAIQQQRRAATATALGGEPLLTRRAPPISGEPPPPRISESEPFTSKIANRYTAERMATGELGQIDPSEGKSTEELVMQGLQMAPAQRERLINNFNRGVGGDLDNQGAAIRAEEARLSVQSTEASRAAAADPTNIQLKAQADAALKAVTDFHNGPVKKLKRVWSDAGRGLQRDIPLDYTTLNGMKEAYMKGIGNGKEAPPEMEPKLKQTADKVTKSAQAEQAAMDNLGNEIRNRTARKTLPSDDNIRARLMEIMKDLPCRT
jgi:hypothetical protein